MHKRIESDIKSEFRNQPLIKLIHKQIELNHLQQLATLAFILHQQRSDTNILYLQFLSEKIEILHKVIVEKKDGNWRSG